MTPFFSFFSPLSRAFRSRNIPYHFSQDVCVFIVLCGAYARARVRIEPQLVPQTRCLRPCRTKEREALAAPFGFYSVLRQKLPGPFPSRAVRALIDPSRAPLRGFLQYRRAGLAREWTPFFCPN